MMVPKEFLNIDDCYQRDASAGKVLEIAKHFDWKLFGALSVVKRNDGSLWVYEGGHRCRATFWHDDIKELPCMVFDADGIKDEAKAFVGANTMRSVVSSYYKHRASVGASEPVAIAAQAILDKHGYVVSNSGTKCKTFKAIRTLHTSIEEDPSLADRVFAACVQIAGDDGFVSGEVFYAIFVCANKLSSIADILSGAHFERLVMTGCKGIEKSIHQQKCLTGLGGPAIAAMGVLEVLNKHKHRKLQFPGSSD